MSNYDRNTLTGVLAPVNPELEKIQNAIADQLDRTPDVGQANEWLDDVDANSQRLYNLPMPKGLTEPVRLGDLSTGIGADGAFVLGWEFILDTEYSAASPLSVNANTWTRLPNNGFVLPQATNLPEGTSTFFDAANNKLVFTEEDNSYVIVEIAFGIIPATANATVEVRGL